MFKRSPTVKESLSVSVGDRFNLRTGSCVGKCVPFFSLSRLREIEQLIIRLCRWRAFNEYDERNDLEQ